MDTIVLFGIDFIHGAFMNICNGKLKFIEILYFLGYRNYQ